MTVEPTSMDGVRVGITASRKGRELATAFERSGALVTWGPTLQTLPPEEDLLLATETEEILAAAPEWVVVSTASGLNAWLDAAGRSGHRAALEDLLRHAQVVARGAKSRGALRGIGVEPAFVSPQETTDDVVDWLEGHVRAGATIAAQVHGGEVVGTLTSLRRLGARILTATPYRWILPPDREPAEELVRQLVDGSVDVLAATSAPCVKNLFLVAAGMGAQDALVRSLKERVCIAAVGAVTARAFEEEGVAVQVMPSRPRSGDLVRAVRNWAARQDHAERPTCGPIELVPGARAVRIGAQVVVLGKLEFAVLAAMVRRPDVVIRPEALAVEAWGHKATDGIATLKHQVARIRRKLGPYASCLQTVRSVGYRYVPLTPEPATAGEARP